MHRGHVFHLADGEALVAGIHPATFQVPRQVRCCAALYRSVMCARSVYWCWYLKKQDKNNYCRACKLYIGLNPIGMCVIWVKHYLWLEFFTVLKGWRNVRCRRPLKVCRPHSVHSAYCIVWRLGGRFMVHRSDSSISLSWNVAKIGWFNPTIYREGVEVCHIYILDCRRGWRRNMPYRVKILSNPRWTEFWLGHAVV